LISFFYAFHESVYQAARLLNKHNHHTKYFKIYYSRVTYALAFTALTV